MKALAALFALMFALIGASCGHLPSATGPVCLSYQPFRRFLATETAFDTGSYRHQRRLATCIEDARDAKLLIADGYQQQNHQHK